MTSTATIEPRTPRLHRRTACEVHHLARTRRARMLGHALMRATRVFAAMIAAAHRRHRQRADACAMYHALRELDDRTLHDLGLERSEIGSVAAEASGESERTRMQTLWHGLP
jgi:uncharacterized protein YjiS (DUF1127 family)